MINKKGGFTLIELLVIISITMILAALLLPCLSLTRERATIVVVNEELYQIALALQMYYDNNKKFPPTQEDCMLGGITKHLYQLPKVLAEEHYLPSMPKTQAMFTNMEDRFNLGHTYKYRSVGETIRDRDIVDKYIKTSLWIPDNFPVNSSLDPNEGQRYYDPKTSPVTWVVFSLGPRFSEEWLEEKLEGGLGNRYPIPKELWYTVEERRGFIVRMQLKNGLHIGSFRKGS